MTDSFLMQLWTVRYDHKTSERNKLQILTCCLKQRRHRDFFEVQRSAAQKRHTKYKLPRQTINQVYTLILIVEHLCLTLKIWACKL